MYEQKGEHDTQYTKHIRLKDNFAWFLTEEFDKLRDGFVPVDNREFMHDPRRKGKGDKKANEEKITPYTRDISDDQYDEFLMISEEMEKEQRTEAMMESDRDTFGGEILKTRLVASGKFTQSQAEAVIDVMLERGIIEKVSYDTYRKKKIDQVAADIYAKEHELLARTHMKMAHDARIKGYFPRDLKEQKELILAAKAWNNYLEPIYHDKYSIDWIALFDEIAEQYRKDNNWPEDREFVRDKRWKIFDDGTLENQFPYTEDHILGDTIVTRVNKIIQISDCFPFMKKVWENNRKTRMTEQMKRNKKKFGKEVKDKNNQQSSLQNIKKRKG